MTSFPGEEINDNIEKLLKIAHVGHVILYSKNIRSPQQVQILCETMQKLAKVDSGIKLNIAIDQEGGQVTRLKGEKFTQFPSVRSIAQTKDLPLSRKCAKAMAQEMNTIGITMNLAPVCDVNTNPKNPVIGLRSFGEDPKTVIEFAKEQIIGFHEKNILTCLKHFPGHGDTAVDSHYGLPIISKDLKSIEETDLTPFLSLSKITDSIMTAHILLPSIDQNWCATFSKLILDKLRNAGYKKLIISDSITMQGALKQVNGNIVEAAIQALQAGCDVLCIGGTNLETQTVLNIHQGIFDAIKNGKLSKERIEESFNRVYAIKNQLTENSLNSDQISNFVGIQEHLELVKEIATRSIQTIKHSPLHSLKNKNIFLFYSSSIKLELEKTNFFKNPLVKSTKSEKELEIPLPEIQKADLYFWVLHNVFKNDKLQFSLKTLATQINPIIIMTVGSAFDSIFFSSFDNVKTIINTFSPTTEAMQVAFDYLEKFQTQDRKT